MDRVLINGLSAKTGGGKSILNNYLSILSSRKNNNDKYVILTPNYSDYSKYECDHIEILRINGLLKVTFLIPLVYSLILPFLIKREKIDVVFNLADIVIPTSKPQVFLFDWSYAVYPDSVVWERMDYAEFIFRKIKLYFFERYLKYATIVVAQTKAIKKRLASIYNISNLTIVNNAVSLENLDGGKYRNFNLPKNVHRLLYLTYYYSHKNIEILVSVAEKIKEGNLPYVMILTISKDQSERAKKLLQLINEKKLNDIIINIEPVNMQHVPSLYKQVDALLMPTLLESFSGTYVEAMFHKKTILTSDLDFAKVVCGKAAFYFDPTDSDSIINTIKFAYENDDVRQERIEIAETKLSEFSSWEKAFDEYQILLNEAKNKLN